MAPTWSDLTERKKMDDSFADAGVHRRTGAQTMASAFALRLREASSANVAEVELRSSLSRITETAHFGALCHVGSEASLLAQARAIDAQAAAGDSLPGALAGTLCCVKDVFHVDGFPLASAGTKLDVSSLIGGSEGTPFVLFYALAFLF